MRQLVDRGESSPPQARPNEPNMTASTRPPAIYYYSVIHERFIYLDIDKPTTMEPSPVSQKSSDSGLHIQLHPLVLLTISDQITRHAARQQRGPILGGLLGQHNGREITLEQAFECPVTCGLNNETILPAAWFEERLQQCEYSPLDYPGAFYEYELTVLHYSQGRTQGPSSRPGWMVVNCSSHRTNCCAAPSPPTDPPELQRIRRFPRLPPFRGPRREFERSQASSDRLRECPRGRECARCQQRYAG